MSHRLLLSYFESPVFKSVGAADIVYITGQFSSELRKAEDISQPGAIKVGEDNQVWLSRLLSQPCTVAASARNRVITLYCHSGSGWHQ